MALFLTCVALVTTTAAGVYPALVLASFNPIRVLKSKFVADGSSGSRLRSHFVIFKFAIAQILIIATLVISSQISFLGSTSPRIHEGRDPERVIDRE